ncbi:MAG: peptidoglycan-binding domain-containing protein [Syntrophomonadaceae bacterium]|nr:peptidoglycan-binding domain-containing protein [Syntrophomonadaceae bacterium]MDD3023452.1 peptidoglycan-binding domain-containing protein [Syntrophomonadaceae bacterium]
MKEGKIKKGNFFFLIFLLAAAIILGSTIGLISNINYIVRQTEILKEKPISTDTEEEKTMAETECEPTGSISPDADSSIPGTQAVNSPAAANHIDIGDEERYLLKEMLYDLGMNESDNFNDFVRSFQNKNSLHATGNIDYATLNAIIQQSTMQEVSRSFKDNPNT